MRQRSGIFLCWVRGVQFDSTRLLFCLYHSSRRWYFGGEGGSGEVETFLVPAGDRGVPVGMMQDG